MLMALTLYLVLKRIISPKNLYFVDGTMGQWLGLLRMVLSFAILRETGILPPLRNITKKLHHIPKIMEERGAATQ
jgi:hypothetical protein